MGRAFLRGKLIHAFLADNVAIFVPDAIGEYPHRERRDYYYSSAARAKER
jgi:hypothetical protein